MSTSEITDRHCYMRNWPSLFTSVVFIVPVFAQDTIWFDAKWKHCQQADAAFYRTTEKRDEGGFIVTDHYAGTNVPQMIAFSDKVDPTFMNGKCTYYFPDGRKESEGYYSDNVATGLWVSWKANGDSAIVDNGVPPRKIIHFKPVPVPRDQQVRDSMLLFSKQGLDKEIYEQAASDFLENRKGFHIIPRGKAATMFIIEDLYFLTWTVGAEFAYNRQSLGVDYTWFRWRSQTDDNDDREIFDELELRRYFYADYKFEFLRFPGPHIGIYFNAYYKYGDYNEWYHPYDYPGVNDRIFLLNKMDGMFTEPGAGLGAKFGDPFGIDISANVGDRITITDNRIYSAPDTYTIQHHAKLDENVFYMRMNLFYRF